MQIQVAARAWFGGRAAAGRTFQVDVNVLRMVKAWIREIGEVDSYDLQVQHVDRLFQRRKVGVRAGTANHERQYFKAFLRWAGHRMRFRFFTEQLMEGWPFLKEGAPREPVILSPEEVERLAAAAEEPWLREFIWMGVGTGLREAPIRRAQLWQVDLKDGVMVVPAEHQKTKKSSTVLLPPRVLEALKARKFDSNLEFVVPGMPGPQAVWRAFKRAVKKAGLPARTRPHDLRATFAGLLRRAGASVDEIKVMGGWRSIGTLLEFYLRQVPVERARQLLGRIHESGAGGQLGAAHQGEDRGHPEK